MPTQKVVHIKTDAAQAPLSPAQKKFNTLIQKIDSQKKLLADWQDTLSQCRQDAVEKLEPLKTTLHEQQIAMVKLLDQQFTSHKFSMNLQDKLSYLILDTCEDLLELDNNAELKTLYNKYSGGDYDAEMQAEQGIADDFIRDRQEKAKQQPEPPEEAASETERPQRKKSAKQQAKEAQEAEEAANVSKSIQAVYRQLTSALHPDREQDPVERERKTELMQQVTVAYGSKDLLKLLELQLAVEHIDQHKLSNINAERLKHYNKILSDQLRELQEEVLLQEGKIRFMLRLSPSELLSPKRLLGMVKEDMRVLQARTARIKHDLKQFRDVAQLKAWLKEYRMP